LARRATSEDGFFDVIGHGTETDISGLSSQVVVGASAGIATVQRLGNDPPRAGIVVATGVVAEGAAGTNKIYSARVLTRMAEEPGPYHNFPGSFDDAIFQGTRTVNPNYFTKPKPIGSDSMRVYDVDLGALAASIRDAEVPADERIPKVRQLEGSSAEKRLAVPLDLATDHALSSEVAAEVGRAVARVVTASDRLDDVPLPDFSGPAYLGYDEQVAASQRAR